MNNLQILAFATGTILIILFSWFVSIKHGRYHGFPRFVAFESILLLILLNISPWFTKPFSPLQIISWILLGASILYAVWSLVLFFRHGEPRDHFEDTTKIVETGIYKYIRHPMYASLLLLGTGTFLKSISLVTVILALVNLAALFLTCKIEEKEMIGRFGDEYKSYMKRTRMWIPYLL